MNIRTIKSYIPEKNFFDGKNKSAIRLFHDDCAILDVNNHFCTIAERGFRVPLGTPFFDAFPISKENENRLRQFLCSEDEIILLPLENTSLLFFSALLQSTGLLLVIRMPHNEKEIRNALEFARRNAFSPIFCPDSEQRSGTAALSEQLSEIFYYTDRILAPESNIGLWTHLLLIANFAGCHLEHVSLPTERSTLTRNERDSLTAFFLCAFLILRYRTGKNEAFADDHSTSAFDIKKNPVFSIHLKHTPIRAEGKMLPRDEQELMDHERSPLHHLLSVPAFKKITHDIQESNFIFEIPICQNTTISATGFRAGPRGYALVVEIQPTAN